MTEKLRGVISQIEKDDGTFESFTDLPDTVQLLR